MKILIIFPTIFSSIILPIFLITLYYEFIMACGKLRRVPFYILQGKHIAWIALQALK